MKPIAIVLLWAFLGWDLGAWAEAIAGTPALAGLVAGVAFGALLAVEVRRRTVAAPHRQPQVTLVPSTETSATLDRAA